MNALRTKNKVTAIRIRIIFSATNNENTSYSSAFTTFIFHSTEQLIMSYFSRMYMGLLPLLRHLPIDIAHLTPCFTISP